MTHASCASWFHELPLNLYMYNFVGSFLNNVMELGEAGTTLELAISCLPIIPPGEGAKEEEEEANTRDPQDNSDESEDEGEGGFACPCTKVGGRSRMHSSSAMATEYSSCAHKEYSNLRFTIRGPTRKGLLIHNAMLCLSKGKTGL